MPMNCASWSIQATLSSVSAANVRCWVCRDRRSTTDQHRCGNRRCGSWPGLTPSTWRIPAAAAAGWWAIWPEMGSRSAVTGCETSCAAWGYGRSTRSLAPRFLGIHPNAFPASWISVRSRLWIRCGPPTSPTSLSRRVFSTWWRSWISSPGTCSAGNSPTALTRSSVCMPWRWRWEMAASQRSSTPIRVASSRHLPSLRGCGQRRSRSAGLEESAVTTTSSLNGCGEPSSTRKSIYVPTRMAGKLRSALPASCGGTAM